MSIASEITRLQNAKTTLKTKLNSRNDNQHQITNELIDEYGDFVDSIPSGGGDIDWSGIGYSGTPQSVQDGYDYAKTIYDNWDSSSTYLADRFVRDENLIYMPLVDTSNCTNFERIFSNCAYLENVPQLDTSKNTTFNAFFSNCSSLRTVSQLNTSSSTIFASMFYQCAKLKYVPQLNTSLATSFGNMFYGCKEITIIPQLNLSNANYISNMFKNCTNLTSLGALTNLGNNYLTGASAYTSNYTLNLSECKLLTHDSLMNVINGLYDIATKGCNTQVCCIGSTNLAKLSAEEIAIATNKGWTVN